MLAPVDPPPVSADHWAGPRNSVKQPSMEWLPLLPIMTGAAIILAAQQSLPQSEAYPQSDDREHALPLDNCGIEDVRDALRQVCFTQQSMKQGTMSQRKRKISDVTSDDRYDRHYPSSLPALQRKAYLRKVTVSSSRSQDFPYIHALHNDTLPIQYSSAFLISSMLSSDVLQLVARRSTASGEERVIGCVTARYCLDQHSISITTLCIEQEAHRRGIASMLLEQLIAATKERCVSSSQRLHSVTLDVQRSNATAIAFYAAQGFHIRGPVKRGLYRGARWGGVDGLEMVKFL